MADSGRTVPPTKRRLDAARARGDVPKSRDLGAAASWIAAGAALAVTVPESCARLLGLAREVFGTAGVASAGDVTDLSALSVLTLARLCLPPLLACWSAVILAGILYSGPTFAPAAITPRLDRLDPAAGLRRIFSGDRWKASAMDVVKTAVLLAIGLSCLRSLAAPAIAATRAGTQAAGSVIHRTILDLAALTGAAAAAIAIVDAVRSRLAWHGRLFMTPREFLDELRETEGDPSLKGQRRRAHREVAEHGMVMAVRDSSFVVVNPTHVAVALRWDEESMDAPEVVASGRHALAQRIIAEARRAGVPVVHDPGLARTLADLRPGETIPEEMYEAVAAVIRVLGEE